MKVLMLGGPADGVAMIVQGEPPTISVPVLRSNDRAAVIEDVAGMPYDYVPYTNTGLVVYAPEHGGVPVVVQTRVTLFGRRLSIDLTEVPPAQRGEMVHRFEWDVEHLLNAMTRER